MDLFIVQHSTSIPFSSQLYIYITETKVISLNMFFLCIVDNRILKRVKRRD